MNEEEIAAQEKAASMFGDDEIETTRTKLTEFFRNNRLEKENEDSFNYKDLNEPYGFQLRYYDYPIYYNWKNMEWQRRQTPRKDKLGRVPTIFESPIGESFYIRKLLFHKAGPTSYSDLRTVDNAEKHTFRDACEAQGLLMQNFDSSSDDNASDSDSMTGKPKVAELNDKYASVVKHGGASTDDDSDDGKNDYKEANQLSPLVSPLPIVKEARQQKPLRSEDSVILESLQIQKTIRAPPEINEHANAPTVILHTRMMTGTMTETEFDSRLRRFANFATIHDYDTDSDVDNIGVDPDADFSDEDEPDGPEKLPQYQMSITQASLIESDSDNSESGLAEKHSKKPSKARQLLKFINEVSGGKSKGNNLSVGGRAHHASTNSLDVVVTDVVGTYNGDTQTKFKRSKDHSKRRGSELELLLHHSILSFMKFEDVNMRLRFLALLMNQLSSHSCAIPTAVCLILKYIVSHCYLRSTILYAGIITSKCTSISTSRPALDVTLSASTGIVTIYTVF